MCLTLSRLLARSCKRHSHSLEKPPPGGFFVGVQFVKSDE